jgi:MYXO-CTERM domain-containing protein
VALGVAVVLALGNRASAQTVEVTITVDNAYGFGFGDVNGISTYFGGLRNVTAGEIWQGPATVLSSPPSPPYTNPGIGPERFILNPSVVSDYLYLVAWSDESAYQGALAGLGLPNGPLLTGNNQWEVYATGEDRDSHVAGDTLTGADLALINGHIATANSETGGSDTSVGWVDENGLMPSGSSGVGELAIGPDNSGGAFGLGYGPVQGISTSARWMWYNEDPATISNPFQYGAEGSDGHNEFLIFRLPLAEVPGIDQAVPEPTSAALALLAAVGLVSLGRRRSRAGRR